MPSYTQNISLVSLSHETGEAVTTTLAIAEGTKNEHASVIKMVRNYLNDYEQFGRVRFEILPFETAGGTQQREIATLNERQATLLISYMRNSEIVRAFKMRLVREFYEMAEALRKPAEAEPFPPGVYGATPFQKINAAVLGRLLALSEGMAMSYLVDLGVTPEYLAPLMETAKGLPINRPQAGAAAGPLKFECAEFAALVETQNSALRWYYWLLKSGAGFESTGNTVIHTSLLQLSYRDWCENKREPRQENINTLGRLLQGFGVRRERHGGIDGKRPWRYVFPPLAQARALFACGLQGVRHV